MQPKLKTTPVIFKEHFDWYIKKWVVTAFFPTLPWDDSGLYITSYAHIGQHGGAHWSYLWGGRKSTPEAYADLLKELVGVYNTIGSPPLEIFQRVGPLVREQFDLNLWAMKGKADAP